MRYRPLASSAYTASSWYAYRCSLNSTDEGNAASQGGQAQKAAWRSPRSCSSRNACATSAAASGPSSARVTRARRLTGTVSRRRRRSDDNEAQCAFTDSYRCCGGRSGRPPPLPPRPGRLRALAAASRATTSQLRVIDSSLPARLSCCCCISICRTCDGVICERYREAGDSGGRGWELPVSCPAGPAEGAPEATAAAEEAAAALSIFCSSHAACDCVSMRRAKSLLRSAAESCPPEAAPGSMPASWELGARTAAVMVASSCCASPLVSGVPPRMAWLSIRAVPLGGGAADSSNWE
mmetsp:Transcript_11962/g.35843  ORF Transcript_11962/g.35843 Transcript_11962/m.35843 type:complete len:295 (-) Transcript_11962:904-1788(-)